MKRSTSKVNASNEETSRPTIVDEPVAAMDHLPSETGVITRAQFRRLSLSHSATPGKKLSPNKNSIKKTALKAVEDSKSKVDRLSPNDSSTNSSPGKKGQSANNKLNLKLKKKNVNNANNAKSIQSDSSLLRTTVSTTVAKPRQTSSTKDLQVEEISAIRITPGMKIRKARQSKEFKGVSKGMDKLMEVADKIVVVDEIKDEEEDTLLGVNNIDAVKTSPVKSSKKKKTTYIEICDIKEEEDSCAPMNNTDSTKTCSPMTSKSSKKCKSDSVDNACSAVEEIKEEEDFCVTEENVGAMNRPTSNLKKTVNKQKKSVVADEVLPEPNEVIEELDEVKEELDDAKEELYLSTSMANADAMNTITTSPKKNSSKKLNVSDIQVLLLENEDDKKISRKTLARFNDRSMLVEKNQDILIKTPTKVMPKSAKVINEGKTLTGGPIENENPTMNVSKPSLQGVDSAQNTVIRPSAQKLVGKAPSSAAENKKVSKKTVIEDDSDSDDDSDAECRKEIMRSAEKRIIRNISTSESESRNVKTFLFNKDSNGNDSDSAPDDVTFDASRKSALDLLKHTVDSIKREKLKKKEQRKERLEILRLRKEENLIRLKERKANQDDASCSSSEESVHEKHGQLSKYELLSKGKKTYFVEEPSGKDIILAKQAQSKVMPGSEKQSSGLKRLPSDLLENLPDQIPKKMKTSYHVPTAKPIQSMERGDKMIDHGSNVKHKRDVDFIPIDGNCSTQFGVVALDKPKLKTVAQQAAEFRHNMLYGNRVSRVPGNVHIKYQQKLKFVNKK